MPASSHCLHLQLGFTINLAKYSLVPSQVMMHISAWIDTLSGLVKPTPGKIQDINLVSRSLPAGVFASVGCLQSMVGLMGSCDATVPLCLFRLRLFSYCLSRNFKQRSETISKIIPLDVLEVVRGSPALGTPLLHGRGHSLRVPAVQSDS